MDSSALMTIYALTVRSREQCHGTFLSLEREETAMENLYDCHLFQKVCI